MTKNCKRLQNSRSTKKTYISLFSSAGIGCYGFKLEGFECIATNEIIQRRLNIQKCNNKCKYDSGYICGDITLESTKKALYLEVDKWKKVEKIKNVDVIIATPPCQGMSVANHKKNNEIVRNSLVVESIKIIKEIHPTFFIFENVPLFMRTICTDIDGECKLISEAIKYNLGENYEFISKIVNFKNYGACSSRSRTIVIGVSKSIVNKIDPSELFPDEKKEKTLRQTIGYLKPLDEMGEIDENDIYHFFRKYPKYMRCWIHDLKEGQSAFDNKDDSLKPHQIINGELIINKRKNSDKYTRQFWDKVGPCVHTRNDQLASQNTIHPSDDRVFSIRELMDMMTIPKTFKWCEYNLDELNNLSLNKKKDFLKHEEINIRQCLGEAVPTVIFKSIANKIRNFLEYSNIEGKQVIEIINSYNLENIDCLIKFIEKNPLHLTNSILSKIAELSNSKRTENAAYYTDRVLIKEIIDQIDVPEKDEIYILEPSVGVGNFIPFIIKKFENKKVHLDLIDIDENSLKIAKALISKIVTPINIFINYINIDFLDFNCVRKYDFIIGNPPFGKLKIANSKLKEYKKKSINKDTTNICSYFLDKAISISDVIFFVFPKFLLNTPEFSETRKYLSKISVKTIIDFGEKGFKGVLIETIGIQIISSKKPDKTFVKSITKNQSIIQNQNYIMDENLPYWIIYRNDFFDKIVKKMKFGVFNVFRDRQITKRILCNKSDSTIRILKSRNLSSDGKIIDIKNYDSFIEQKDAINLSVYKFLNDENVYLTPNMTYKPRMIKKPANCLMNGSIAILIPKTNIIINNEQMRYYETKEYFDFYQIARNYQTRSINIDTCSVYFFGILKE